MRQLYFERVDNVPDFTKFVEFYKWIDSSIVNMLLQLKPGSAKFSSNLRTMIESHVLERNKYLTKFPTLDTKDSPLEAGLYGINEMLYPWKRGHSPVSGTAANVENNNCLWWFDRASGSNQQNTSGDANIDKERDIYRVANDFRSGSGHVVAVSRDSTSTTTTYEAHTYALRNFTKIYNLSTNKSLEIHGGSNFPKDKKLDYAHTELKQILWIALKSNCEFQHLPLIKKKFVQMLSTLIQKNAWRERL